MEGSRRTIKWVRYALVVAVPLGAVLLFWPLQEASRAPQKIGMEVKEGPAVLDSEEATIGSAWRWENFEGESEADSADDMSNVRRTELVFDVPLIYDSLQQVRLDEQGNVIIDDRALRALNDTLAAQNLNLDAQQLRELQELIRIGLPGNAGEQTAEVVGDYYRFLQAEKEFNELRRETDFGADPRAGFEELVALRELYLGRDVAAGLFAKADRDARYMIASMELARDESLSEEERQERQQALSEAIHHPTPDIPNWDQRYAAFEQAADAVRAAGLSEEESEQQLSALLSQHFSAEEIPAVLSYRSDEVE